MSSLKDKAYFREGHSPVVHLRDADAAIAEVEASVIELRSAITEDDVFTLIGYAEGLLAQGLHDMPTYFYELACRLARITGKCELIRRTEELRASRMVKQLE